MSVIDSNIFSDWPNELLAEHVWFRATDPTFSLQKLDDVRISWLELDTFRKARPWNQHLKMRKSSVMVCSTLVERERKCVTFTHIGVVNAVIAVGALDRSSTVSGLQS